MPTIKCIECGKIIDSRSKSKKCWDCYIKNRTFSKEQRQKMREIKKKNPINYWLGKKRPEIKKWLTPFKKGNIPWNKGKNISGMSGKKHNKETIEKMKNAKNSGWIKKGDKLPKKKRWGKSYRTLHKWIVKDFGIADICVICGSTKRVEWSNKDHEYNLDRKDWQKLCRKCHWEYDHKIGLR